jgi:phage minor structural protein
MYKVVIENDGEKTVIFAPDSNTAKIYGGVCKDEISAIPSFSFNIYPNNPAFSTDGGDLLKSQITKITAHDLSEDSDIFIGRVLTAQSSMDEQGNLCKSVVCEGEMGFLCDTVQPHKTYASGTLSTQIFNAIIENHNSHVGSDKRFEYGECELAGLPEAFTIDYETTFETLQSIFCNLFGGEIRVRHVGDTRYLDFAIQFGEYSQTKIRLSENLKSITQTKSAEGIVTRLYPLGGTKSNGERLTIETEGGNAGGKTYIENADLVKKYGIIEQVVIFDDIVGEGSEEHAAAVKLYNKGVKYFESLAAETVQTQLTALDLAKAGYDFESFKLYNTHAVYNPLLGIYSDLRITGISTDMDNPQSSALTFGGTVSTATRATATQQKTSVLNVKKVEKSVGVLTSNFAESLGGLKLAKTTQSEYDALESTDENTVYLISDGTSTMYERLKKELLETLNNRLNGLSFLTVTQSEYDETTSPDENTVYIITEGENDTE